MLAKIHVRFRRDVESPENAHTMQMLRNYPAIVSVDKGKYFEITLDEMTYRVAYRQVRNMCESLLANPIYEEYSFQLEKNRGNNIKMRKPSPWFYFNKGKWKTQREVVEK
ncbi:MAG: phosphoribosylformylglycinamidine synthase subunit PurS [Candidatus Aenigmarchaeota archaeon]|nr:phosphoribosylformylglycinamidine synthase subunit PurS [Candidatus Aenigmarchaeota archaeon]